MTTTVLAASHLTVRYDGAVALDDVSVDLPAGSVTAVLGRNGAGKTTLLRALCGTVGLSAGVVSWRSRPLRRRPGPFGRDGLGFVPESGNVFADLTVAENLRSALPWERRAAVDARVAAVLAVLPLLEPLLARRAGVLSGGQRQALAIARVLVAAPAVILADEPSLGLAPTIAGTLLTSLVDTARRQGTTVVLAEQNARLAGRLADRIVHLESGRVLSDPTHGYRQ